MERLTTHNQKSWNYNKWDKYSRGHKTKGKYDKELQLKILLSENDENRIRCLNLKNIDLVKKLLKVCKSMGIKIGKKTKIKFVKDRPGHDFRYALNNKKIFKRLKWKPKIKFEKGLKETVNWYIENKNFLKKISKSQYEKRLGLKL